MPHNGAELRERRPPAPPAPPPPTIHLAVGPRPEPLPSGDSSPWPGLFVALAAGWLALLLLQALGFDL